MENEEEDPFAYTPLVSKRGKFATQPLKETKDATRNNVTGKKTRLIVRTQENSSRLKSPVEKKSRKSTPKSKRIDIRSYVSPVKVLDVPKSEENEVCSICQMPFNLLLRWESPEVHASNCLELAIDKMPPCDMGIYCDITIRNHYAQFSHKELASHRSLIVTDHIEKSKISMSQVPDCESMKSNKQLFPLLNNIKEKNGAVITNALSNGNAEIEHGKKQKDTNAVVLNDGYNKKEKMSSKVGSAHYTYSPEESYDAVKCAIPNSRVYLNEVPQNTANGMPDPEMQIATSKRLIHDMDSTCSTEPVNSFDSVGSSDKRAPLKVAADKDSQGDYRIKVSVNPKVELNQFEMKIMGNKNDKTQLYANCDIQDGKHVTERIKVKSVITPKKRHQVTVNSYFKVDDINSQSSTKSNSSPVLSSNTSTGKNNIFDLMMRAKQNGFTVPKQHISSSVEKSDVTRPRKCPFYKKIPGTSFVVDAFSYEIIPGITKYFLSHFHYDHYIGLRKRFCYPIICSKITANLIRLKIGVESKYLKVLKLNEPTIIEGTEVTLLDANHCPGSVMFLFNIPVTNQTILHCGDFRACPQMEEYPSLWNNRIDKLFLDTTYCKPEYDFPSQGDAILTSIDLIKQHLKETPKTLFVCGTYTIGKERLFLAIAEEFDWTIWANTEKKKILHALENTDISNRLSDSPDNAKIHLMEMGKVKNFKFLSEYREKFAAKYDHILSIIPTGWTHQKGSTSESSLKNMKIKTFKNHSSQLEIPYSEHSSFSELKRFVRFLKLSTANSVIPTVNIGSANSRDSMSSFFRKWIKESST